MKIFKFTEFISEDNIQLFEIDYLLVEEILLEEVKAKVFVPYVTRNYISNKITSIYNSPNKDYYELGKIKLTIEPTEHWLERLYRKSDPDYAKKDIIVNPTLDEGLDILHVSLGGKLAEYINKLDWSRKDRPCVELLNDTTNYSEILGIDRINKDNYKIKLITQIKGARMYSKKYNTSRLKMNENRINELKSIDSYNAVNL